MDIDVSGNYIFELTSEASNIRLQCKSGNGAVNITLPKISTIEAGDGLFDFRVFIDDVNNNASENNITLIPDSSDKINDVLAPLVLSINGITGCLKITGVNSWTFVDGITPLFGGYIDKTTDVSLNTPRNPSTINTTFVIANVLTHVTSGSSSGFNISVDGTIISITIDNNGSNVTGTEDFIHSVSFFVPVNKAYEIQSTGDNAPSINSVFEMNI